MQVIELGQLIADEPKRDAVHIAVVPVMLAGRVYPGDHVGLDRYGRASNLAPTLIGVIDPFLKDMQLCAGLRVWMFLYPGSINQLRHVTGRTRLSRMTMMNQKSVMAHRGIVPVKVTVESPAFLQARRWQ
jgi:hypothetical protein